MQRSMSPEDFALCYRNFNVMSPKDLRYMSGKFTLCDRKIQVMQPEDSSYVTGRFTLYDRFI